MTNRSFQRGPQPRQDAHAPYNFVPLPDKTIPGESLTRHDKYLAKRHTGYFDVTLTTETPLYIRGMLLAAVIKADAIARQANPDKKKLETPEFFEVAKQLRLPGSSLRGMLRSLVEIITFSKIQPVADSQDFFFRAVAAQRDDPLRDPYKAVIGSFSKNVRAGYLHKHGESWLVRPAQRFGQEAFAKVKDRFVSNIPGLKRFNDPNYTLQYHNVDFEEYGGKIGSATASANGAEPMGVLVCTGNMAETQGKATTSAPIQSPRRSYVIVLPVDRQKAALPIPPQVVKDYIEALTPFQKEAPLDPEQGVLKQGRPVFYIEENGEVIRFGHTPNFRIGHLIGQKAVTTHDRLPIQLRTGSEDPHEAAFDYAESMFGYVIEGVQQSGGAYASRVSVTSAVFSGVSQTALEPESLMPKILGSPKLTTFQHYLEQPQGKATPLANLHHWGTKGAKIRGHKLYWRKRIRGVDAVRETDAVRDDDKQHTHIRPVKANVQFQFRIHFENLRPAELGALAWALSLGGDPEARHMLGMGKPYGLGVVKLDPSLTLINRQVRYSSLFDEAGDWQTGQSSANHIADEAITAFKAMIQKQTGQAFDEHPRIRELKVLLRRVAPQVKYDYMTIEPNQFKDRPVLPRPSEV